MVYIIDSVLTAYFKKFWNVFVYHQWNIYIYLWYISAFLFIFHGHNLESFKRLYIYCMVKQYIHLLYSYVILLNISLPFKFITKFFHLHTAVFCFICLFSKWRLTTYDRLCLPVPSCGSILIGCRVGITLPRWLCQFSTAIVSYFQWKVPL